MVPYDKATLQCHAISSSWGAKKERTMDEIKHASSTSGSVKIKHHLLTLGISPKRSVVCGSGAIAARYPNFRKCGDLDVVVSLLEFLRLSVLPDWQIVRPQPGASWREARLTRGDCEAFLTWKSGDGNYVPYRALKAQSKKINSVYYVSLKIVEAYKKYLLRMKDVKDLEFLRQYTAV